MTVPDEFLLLFFQNASKALADLDCRAEIGETLWVLADCRRCLLDKQRSVLNRSVAGFNSDRASSFHITDEQVQQRLAKIKTEPSLSPEILESMEKMNESARLALCRLVLYTESHSKEDPDSRDLQREGNLDRSRLLEYIALCRTAIKLECVQNHLTDAAIPLFEDLPPPDADEPTAFKLPQTRLEKIEGLIARAVGWHHDFATNGIKRIFLTPGPNEFSDDKEVIILFQQLVMEMRTVVMQASLQANQKPMSDTDQGGVTTVVAVNYSEVGEEGEANLSQAPRQSSIDPSLTEEEQKRQIRIASEAARLQQALLEELLNMPETERAAKLREAKNASDDFLKRAMDLPVGRERIAFLQSVDPRTQKLLAMHKIWNGLLLANGGKVPSSVAKN